MGEQAAWLVLAVGDDRQHGGNDGYDDDPAIRYSWDSTVPHHQDLAVGDIIAVWNKKYLLGISVIESIAVDSSLKLLKRCPYCELAGIKARKNLRPAYKCYKCGQTFDEPVTFEKNVTTYEARHETGWIDLLSGLKGERLRQLCKYPTTQHSLRELRWEEFRSAVLDANPGAQLSSLDAVRQWITRGGHIQRVVRVRVAQTEFRSRILDQFQNTCAFTGPGPETTLEAAHLYSYGKLGEHHVDGGLLLRRDIHRLFDDGMLAVEPSSLSIDVHPYLAKYATYQALAGAGLRVPLSDTHKRWLAAHWAEYRSDLPAA